MGSALNINYDKTSVPFEGLRADISIDPPTLTNYDNDIGVVDREYLGDFITGMGAVKRTEPFPETFGELTEAAVWVDTNQLFEVYELVNGDLLGLKAQHLENAIRFCGGVGGFNPDDYELYIPSGTDGHGLFFLTSDYTPPEFIIHRLFGDRESFLEQFGATACPECETVADDPFVDCPTCGERPASVIRNIDTIQQEHDGVLVLLAPFGDWDGTLTEAVERGQVTPKRPTGGVPLEYQDDGTTEAPEAEATPEEGET